MKAIEECLDIVLNQLVKNWNQPNEDRYHLQGEKLLQQFELPQFMQKHEFIKRLIQKLIKDGYAETRDDTHLSQGDALRAYEDITLITIEGFYFITEQGGYTTQRNNKILSIQAQNDLNQRTERNEERLVAWTKNLTYGTIGIVGWEMIKTFWIEGHWKIFLCH